ncbi:hypothetical protein GCM10010503_17170 [Streptomyces lucensis JCM 4490]|uniref:Uncharacterized protein n=1 Tax=Streptomyces lucensis JCM 4490 TaxID=1306176 RepID=A0A918J0U0_9ACTN|nr:DUF3040 domain-containing protein [Streptomyces lucensis]GGW41545.1 hypothetical protein GCM10010503_17170 [Streptomyces lucensis JCM 4490]
MAVDDWEMREMHDKVRLSRSERLALLRIEAVLRQDRRFTRRMGTPRREFWLPAAVLLLGAASVFVAVMGIRTYDPALLWCFALLWPLTLFQAFRLRCRSARPRPRPDAGTTHWL